MQKRQELTEHECELFEWQFGVDGFGKSGQLKLRNATALISRAGGMGGPLALQLASAGIGKLIIAHGGNLRYDDLNRQVLMAYDNVGKERAVSIRETLQRFNPLVELEVISENITSKNVSNLVSQADIVFDCAPLFEERYLMNHECVLQGKPLIDCAMFGTDGQVFPINPGKGACLSCLYPTTPEHWKRKFPVIGSVSFFDRQHRSDGRDQTPYRHRSLSFRDTHFYRHLNDANATHSYCKKRKLSGL